MENEKLVASNDLPDTDPCQNDVDNSKPVPHWGKLIQLTDNGLRNNGISLLTDEVYRIGRAPTCELPISEYDFYDEKYILISKVHFKLEIHLGNDEHLVFLEDLSFNGTFVNGERVGKNSKVLLTNASIISLAKPELKMYLYLDNATNNNRDVWLHSSLSDNFYTLISLGCGTYGDVRLVLHRETGKKFAMKKILKDRMPERRIHNEVNILKKLTHPCIVQLVDLFDTLEAVFITLEYISGGNLLNRIRASKNRKIPEVECQVIFYQLCLGVQYLHNEGITHRDLKPENILLDKVPDSKDPIIKITDFGLSKIQTEETHLRTNCGTLSYIAPEVLNYSKKKNYSYNNKVDIWSLGVILFFCLSGKLPFSSEEGNTVHLVQLIMRGKYRFSPIAWHGISAAAMNAIKRILETDPLRRITISELLRHPWLQDKDMRDRITYLINERSVEDLEPVLKKQKMM